MEPAGSGRRKFMQMYVFPPDYPNLARISSTVISAVMALPDGEKLKLPEAASRASSAAASSRDMRRAVCFAAPRAITAAIFSRRTSASDTGVEKAYSSS